MIDLRGLWENFPVAAAILCVGGIICYLYALLENKNNENDENMEELI